MPDRLPVARVVPWWRRYGLAVALVTAAVAVTPLLPPIAREATFALFFAAVAITAAIGGLGPAAVAIALSAACADFFLIAPYGSFALAGGDALRLAVFVGVALLIGGLSDLHLRESRRERASREWSEVTLASIGDAVMVTDAEGRVRFLNRVAESLTGWSRDAARGHPLPEVFRIVHESTRATVEDPVARVRREGRVVGLANHTVLIARDGTEVPIDDSGAPIWSEDGRLAGAVLVFRDIRERKEAERRQAALLESEQQARAEAQAANRAKDEFLATLSHELRTPLNAILGWAEVLRSGPAEPDDVTRALEVIERNVRRQARLIDDVLDVSRIVSGRLRLELEPVDTRRVVDAALEVVRPSAEAKGIRLDLRVDDVPPVLGDPERLQQVVWNLLSNAIKFTPEGGRVEVRLRRTDGRVELAVQDTGQGIAPDFLPEVFERFRQQDAGSNRAHAGLGLGLAIVRHLVEMHGGQVDAASDGPGCGSTFTVRLPVASGVHPHASPTDGAVAAAPDLAGLRVLAVDDEADARELIQTMLGRAGAEVRVAGSAAEAMSVVGAWSPDVLLCDLEMPGDDGYALLERLREAGFVDLPAVAFTAYAGAADRVRALTAGFQLHLPKPVGQAELQLVVASAARWRPAPKR